MLIRVTKTTKAAKCPMGNSIKLYQQGETYDMHDSLAKTFIDNGWGNCEVSCNDEQQRPEQKAISEINNKAVVNLQNKAITSTRENKSKSKRK